MTFEPHTHPAPDHDNAARCGCSCCADALNRASHDRNPFAGCNCHDYPVDQRCDCPLCAYVQIWGGTNNRSVAR